MSSTYFIAGGTSGVGAHVVRKLLGRGERVRLLARSEAGARDLWNDRVELVVGDARDAEAVKSAMGDADYVVCTIGARFGSGVPEEVDYGGVRNLVDAAVASGGVKHFVLVSSISTSKREHPLNQRFMDVLNWKFRGEEYLRNSGLAYTVVRAGGLRDEPGGRKALQLDQGDRISGPISRETVAEVCLRAIEEPGTRNVTFEVIESEEGTPPADWAALFEGLEADR